MVGKRVALSLLLSMLVACGGAAPSTGGARATGTATATAAATGPRLSEVLAAAKLSQNKVTYRIGATGEGADAFAGEQTWYFKPPKARFDFPANFGGAKMTTSVFSLPEGNFYCSMGAGSAQCFTVGVGTGSPLDSNVVLGVQQQILAQPERYTGVFTEMKSIAGQQGYCYAVTGGPGTIRSGTFCYTKDGVMLLSQFGAATPTGSSTAMISMEATSVSTTVPDSDFNLPATPLGR